MTPATYALLRWSLVFVWLATAIVSVVELNGQSRALLVSLPPAWSTPGLAHFLILAGATADAVIGLHPLGPLTKNLPIAAILLVLLQDATTTPPKP